VVGVTVGYLVGLPANASVAAVTAGHTAYRSYLESVRTRIPERALEFAVAPWHYDPTDHRCPHDAWLNSVVISEPAGGKRREQRGLEVRVELLGAYHDGLIRLTYPGVRRYELLQPGEPGCSTIRGHGDWLIDELSVPERDQGLVVHQIAFSHGAVWTIEAEDVIYEWLPGSTR
jgi:hypothetical protein